MCVSRTYSVVAFLIGVPLLVAAFLWRFIPWPFLRTEYSSAIAFAVSAALAIPFIITYTVLGLNWPQDESTPPSPETEFRHQILNRECPIWPIAWRGAVGFTGVSWATAAFTGTVHPFFAYSAALCCLTGTWFLFAFPIARRLFAKSHGAGGAP